MWGVKTVLRMEQALSEVTHPQRDFLHTHQQVAPVWMSENTPNWPSGQWLHSPPCCLKCLPCRKCINSISPSARRWQLELKICVTNWSSKNKWLSWDSHLIFSEGLGRLEEGRLSVHFNYTLQDKASKAGQSPIKDREGSTPPPAISEADPSSARSAPSPPCSLWETPGSLSLWGFSCRTWCPLWVNQSSACVSRVQHWVCPQHTYHASWFIYSVFYSGKSWILALR